MKKRSKKEKKDHPSNRDTLGGEVNLHKGNTDGVHGDLPTSIIAQPIPLPNGRQWIQIDRERPPYYASSDIWDGKELYEDWARVSNGDKDFYVNNRDNRVKYHITHWSKRPGVKYSTYEPMTIKDLIITDLDGEMIVSDENSTDDVHGFNTGIKIAIDIINKRMTGT